ncbi:MAG: hypothetical protein ABFD89_23820 [Bryobacteraceae bacterium]
MFSLGGWAFGIDLGGVLKRAATRINMPAGDFQHLSADSDDANERVAEMVNGAVAEFLEANPALGVKTADLEIVAGTMGYAIPADLQGLSVLAIETAEGRRVQYLNADELAHLPEWWRQGEFTAENPECWAFDETGAMINLYPMPSADQTARITYRQQAVAITAENVAGVFASPEVAVTIGEIPVRFSDVLALQVAWQLVANTDPDKADRLLMEAVGRLEKAQGTIADVSAQWGPGRWGVTEDVRRSYFDGMA